MTKTATAERPFYQLTVDEAVARLKSDPVRGLTQHEAGLRLAIHGPNRLAEGKKRPVFLRFLDQFKDFLILVLIVAALIAYYLGDLKGGTVLLCIVMVNAAIGFVQEYKAERILEKLKLIVRAHAIVIRDGQRREVMQDELVPGDLVYLEEGGAIPADIRLVRSTHFSTNDMVLTGESVPQPKSAELVFDHDRPLTDRDNLVFMGVTVARGDALGVVFATGMETAIGHIARSSESIGHEQSPLQIEMDHVARVLTRLAGAIALALFVISFLMHWDSPEGVRRTIQLSFLFALSVAAACVPQGLPAQVSVALSLGVGRLARLKAVVRKLSAVETLGAATVICSDKTGTITRNEMTIIHAFVDGREFDVGGDGYGPKGSLTESGKRVSAKALAAYRSFFSDGFLASNGRVNPPDMEHRHWYAVGDPTEAAFTPLAIKAGLDPARLESRFPLVRELPFDSDRKRMTMVRRHKGRLIAYMKGGMESVLSVCESVNEGGKVVPLTPLKIKRLMAHEADFAAQSLRVIALAYRDLPRATGQGSVATVEKDFVFSGFVTMMDPPREGVREAVGVAFAAGIRIMMITGDQAATAQAIARRIGMGEAGSVTVVTGEQLRHMDDRRLSKTLRSKSLIFSRVSPHDKLRIVTVLKRHGEVVAVTGDGVNDSLSLKKSDIGVAMGRAGSEVAKEASEMILLDDNFRTIVVAIREGRTIYHNLRKTILSTITSNNGELFCVLLGFIGVLFGLPAPITAVQILAVDMIGEMLPLTALTFDPPDRELMTDRPRSLKAHILNFENLASLLFYGFWMGATGFFSFVMVHAVGGASVESGRSAAYAGIMMCQFVNIFSRRSNRTLFSSYLFTNPRIWGALLISIVFVLVLVYSRVVSGWFGFGPLGWSDWRYPLMGAVFLLALHEIRKLWFFLVPRN